MSSVVRISVNSSQVQRFEVRRIVESAGEVETVKRLGCRAKIENGRPRRCNVL